MENKTATHISKDNDFINYSLPLQSLTMNIPYSLKSVLPYHEKMFKKEGQQLHLYYHNEQNTMYGRQQPVTVTGLQVPGLEQLHFKNRQSLIQFKPY